MGESQAASPSSRWIVLHAKSRQEKALAEDLSARGLELYLPLIRSVRYYGRRKAKVELPLFPGYVFLHGEREDGFTADRTGRVVSVLQVSDQKSFADEIAQIKAVLERDGRLVACDPIVNGTLVEVKSGPFRGVRGVVERGMPHDRLVIQVSMIGKGSELEIDRSLLEAAAGNDR